MATIGIMGRGPDAWVAPAPLLPIPGEWRKDSGVREKRDARAPGSGASGVDRKGAASSVGGRAGASRNEGDPSGASSVANSMGEPAGRGKGKGQWVQTPGFPPWDPLGPHPGSVRGSLDTWVPTLGAGEQMEGMGRISGFHF